MAKSPSKRDNARGSELEAMVAFPGVEHLTGTIVRHDEHGVQFQYYRYGSRYTQVFPASQIITCLGTVGSDECELWYRTGAKTLFDKGKRDRGIPISEPKQYGSHLLRASSPDYSVILLDPTLTTIIGKSTGDTGRGKRKKASGGEGAEKSKRSKDKGSGRKAAAKKSNGKKDDWA